MICQKCLGYRRGTKIQPTHFCAECIRLSIVYKCRTAQPYYVYKLLDKMDTVIYVGVTDKPRNRFSAHARVKKFWSMVLVQSFVTWEAALQFERALIAKLRPVLNKQVCTSMTAEQTKKILQQGHAEEYLRVRKRQTLAENSRMSDLHDLNVTNCKPCYYNGWSELAVLSFSKR